MVALPPAWDAFIDLVEGREAPTSCEMVGGIPRFSAEPIPPNAVPTLSPLVQLLQSDAPLPRRIRLWLADLMSAESPTTLRLELKRSRGQPRASIGRGWDAAIRFHELCESTTRQRALHQAGDEFALSRSAIEAAIRGYAEACREHERVLQEG